MCWLSVLLSLWSSFHHLGARTANSHDFDECLARSEAATRPMQSGVNGLGCNVGPWPGCRLDPIHSQHGTQVLMITNGCGQPLVTFLSRFIFRWCADIQWEKSVRQAEICAATCVSDGGKERISWVSSACEWMTEPRELVYWEKRRGPKTEPWGTPVVRGQGSDTVPLQVTR